jgi:hypothetical protein
MARPYKGYPSRYAYRKAVGRYVPGTTGAERARRAKREREAVLARLQTGPRVSWQPIPGGQGRAVVTSDPEVVREALRQARAEGRQVYIVLRADTVGRYPGQDLRKHAEGRAFLGSLPPGTALGLIDRDGGDVFGALEDLARRQGTEVEGINEVNISSYPR